MGQADRQRSASEFNGDVGKLIHSAEVQLRELQPNTGNQSEGASNLSFIIHRISETPLIEIERVIAELQAIRQYLLDEGQRVQREIAKYAHMSQAAANSTKAVVESLAQWRPTAELDRGARR